MTVDAYCSVCDAWSKHNQEKIEELWQDYSISDDELSKGEVCSRMNNNFVYGLS